MANRIEKRHSLLFVLSMRGILVAMIAFSSGICMGDEIQYFNGSINYWKSQLKELEKEPKLEITNPRQEIPKGEDGTIKENTKTQEFQWKKYLDPKNTEFFREGDYTPPEPFMELVRNPSDQNIRMWFAYMDSKNELAGRLSKRMEEYAQNNNAVIPKAAKEKIVQAAHQIPTPADDFERFRFRMYFDSQCPHCTRMFETLNDLQDRGYFVEARQVDRGSLEHIKSNVAIVSASSAEVKKQNIAAVPLLLIGDLRNKKVYRQSGFMTPEQILAQIHER